METKQYNIKVPTKLAVAAEGFAQRYGYRNLQELALDSLREKVFENNIYDETFGTQEIELIDSVILASKNNLVNEQTLRKVLRK